MIREMATFVEPQLPTGFRTRLQRPGMESGVIQPANRAAPAPSAPANAAPAAAPAASPPAGETKPPQ